MEYDLQTGASDVDLVLEDVVMFQRPWPEVKIIVKTVKYQSMHDLLGKLPSASVLC